MANRKRGTFSLPEELRTTERLSTKKELAQRKSLPPCPPVPYKMRKSLLTSTEAFDKPKPVCFNQTVELSPIYNPDLNTPYLDQVFSQAGLVGEGSFGRVYRACNRQDNQLYAIKRLKSVISFKDRYAEVRNNEKIGVHPNCVQFFMAWEECFEVYMMLEYCDMSLADFSFLNSDIPEDLLWNVLYDLCKALDYLHKKELLHLDVKPGNIMIKGGSYKLADFGILVDLKLGPTFRKSTLSDGDSKYLALEVLDGIYKPSCDIFGLGISLLELASDLELPSYGPLWQQLRHDVLPQPFYDRVSLGFKVIIERMLNAKHSARPSAEKILKYNMMKAITKRDKKTPRVNYVESYVNNDEFGNLHALPIMINNNNNDDDDVETPACSPSQLRIEEVNFRGDGQNCYVRENEGNFAGRKALFHILPEPEAAEDSKHIITLSEMNKFFENSLAAKTEDETALASVLKDTSFTSELFELDMENEEKEESFIDETGDEDTGDELTGDELTGDELPGDVLTSTPILRCRKLSKTKLSFE